MRDIKFRAHIKKLNWVVPVERINFDCKTVEVDLSKGNGDTSEYDFNEVELMQYTGLKDKNGVEIYEGDIVLNGAINYIVVFYKGAWRLKRDIDGDTWWKSLYRYIAEHKVEITGNIYENPELLKEDK